MLLPAYLPVGQLDGAEVRILALCVATLSSVETQTQGLVAMLGGKVRHGQCTCRAWRVLELTLDDPFDALAFTVLALAFACACASTFVDNDLLCTRLQQCVHVAADLGHLLENYLLYFSLFVALRSVLSQMCFGMGHALPVYT